MRYLLLVLIVAVILAPVDALAITGQDTRFDFNGGVTAITANATSECNSTAVARFDFNRGVPAIVYDATATCTAATSGNTTHNDIIWFE